MAFGWVIRHQKKALFVLAVVLIVGWGVGGIIGISGRGGTGANRPVAVIAGEEVTAGQFSAFNASWRAVFPERFSPEFFKRYYGETIGTSEELAWAWYGMLTVARQQHVRVDDAWILDMKRRLYRSWSGRQNGMLDDEAERFFRDRLGVSSRQLDIVIREMLMAQQVLEHIIGALEPTSAEAWERYAKENRAVRVRQAVFPASSFLAKVPVPDNAAVAEWYEARKGPGGDYYTPPTVQIEYAQLLFSKLESDIAVSTDDMKAYYDLNKDLYKLKDATEGHEAEYLPFPEVKPEIEGILKRQRVGERAAKIIDDVRAAFLAAAPQTTLEDVLKANPQPGVEYVRTPFVTEIQLLDLAGIGTAHADGGNLVQLVVQMDPTRRQLSPVMANTDGLWVFRLMAPPRDGVTPDLVEVRPRVVEDIRRSEALKLADNAASAFDNAVLAAGASCFDTLASERGLAVTETPFFVNRYYDAVRPDYIDRESPLKVGAVYGPWVSTRDAVAAVVKVVEERAADRAGFAGDEKVKRAQVLTEKSIDYQRHLLPKEILGVLKFRSLLPPRPAEPSEETPEGDNTTMPVPDNSPRPAE